LTSFYLYHSCTTLCGIDILIISYQNHNLSLIHYFSLSSQYVSSSLSTDLRPPSPPFSDHHRHRTVVTHHRITTPSSPSPPFVHLYQRFDLFFKIYIFVRQSLQPLAFFFSFFQIYVSGGHEVEGWSANRERKRENNPTPARWITTEFDGDKTAGGRIRERRRECV
jgi:hypothetical protein